MISLWTWSERAGSSRRILQVQNQIAQALAVGRDNSVNGRRGCALPKPCSESPHFSGIGLVNPSASNKAEDGHSAPPLHHDDRREPRHDARNGAGARLLATEITIRARERCALPNHRRPTEYGRVVAQYQQLFNAAGVGNGGFRDNLCMRSRPRDRRREQVTAGAAGNVVEHDGQARTISVSW